MQTSNKDRTGVDEGPPTPVRDCRGSGECASSKRDERLAARLLFPWRFSGDFPAAAAAITADYPPSAQMCLRQRRRVIRQQRTERVKRWRLISTVASSLPNLAALVPQTRSAPSPRRGEGAQRDRGTSGVANSGFPFAVRPPSPRGKGAHRARGFVRRSKPGPVRHRPALRSRRGWRPSHCAITAAMAALFFSSIIMWPLPRTPRSARRMSVLGTPAWER
jgi:hypothetical protein